MSGAKEKQNGLDGALAKALDDAGAGEEQVLPEADQPEPGEVVEETQPEGQEDEPEESRVTPEEGKEDLPAQQRAGQKPTSGNPTAANVQPKGGKAAAGGAPTSWAAAVREKWAELPRPVKDQILKREGEFARVRQEGDKARQQVEQITRVFQPFLPHLQAAGVQPLAQAASLLQVDYNLRMGTPAQKAQVIKNAMEHYGVDVGELAAIFEGKQQPSKEPAQPQKQLQDPRMDQLLGELQQLRNQRSLASQQRMERELADFAQSHEFFEDVREDMADILAAEERKLGTPLNTLSPQARGEALERAYQRACKINESVSSVLAGRKAKQSQQQSQKVQSARHASGSVRSEPSPPREKKPSLEDAVRELIFSGKM